MSGFLSTCAPQRILAAQFVVLTLFALHQPLNAHIRGEWLLEGWHLDLVSLPHQKHDEGDIDGVYVRVTAPVAVSMSKSRSINRLELPWLICQRRSHLFVCVG
ncbi:hypothetical protein [Pseudovibrio sp. Tun.PSC04-5.I4]|uniref:hypothetical protein n=1 Tax=Pseudovibrio sp. Tun.PSC04-5.I4 TaxID=1798213 RepID=UPI00190ECCD5|nr:hypothetical protein [Pseudovibrio sp. Tun.PSC04-5.I4]